MIAKMPMTGSPEKRRDCIAQVPLRVTSSGILACPKSLFISTKKLFRFVSLEVNCPSAPVGRGFSPSADCRAAEIPEWMQAQLATAEAIALVLAWAYRRRAALRRHGLSSKPPSDFLP